jgi:hypothetical protein
MEDKQTRKFNSGVQCLQVIDNYNSIWSANANATSRRDLVETTLDAIHDLETKQQTTSTGGEELTKEEAKHLMAETTQSISQSVCAYALDINDHTLYNLMNKKSSTIENLKDIAAEDFCNAVWSYADSHLASLLGYNITGLMLSDLQTQIGAFHTANPAPVSAKGQHKTATTNMGHAITTMLSALLWWDHYTSGLHVTEPDFTSDFANARHIVDTGIRHMSIRGVVTDSVNHTPLYRAKISIVSAASPPTIRSGKSGKFHFLSLDPGVYTLKVEMEGYQTLTIPNVSVLVGKITDLAVSLVAA